MDVFILNKAPQLLVYHPVKLGYERYIIPIFPVLGEEREPFIPALLLPVPGVEHQLTLINNQQDRAFPDAFPLKERPGVVDQILRVQLVVGNISVSRLFEAGQVTGEVADHRPTKPGAVDHIFSVMQALPGAWCAGVQSDHIIPPF